jgi:hypothetical protein
MIFIFSAPRSGSTWLGKIFDSHPDVLYLHEPEIPDRGLDLLPFWFEDAPNDAHVVAARVYLKRLLTARTPRATGARPFFRKNYRSGVAERCRRGLIYLAKGSERVFGSRYSNFIRIPDLIDRGPPGTFVIKSVSALGRMEVLIKAANGSMRPVLLVRHPCGYIASMLRGDTLGVMQPAPALGRLAYTRSAEELGARELALSAVDQPEKLAWNWLLSNAEGYAAIRAVSGTIIVYETFANRPMVETKALFEQVGLSWTAETEQFLLQSTTTEGGYYSVSRDPAKAINRWRKQLGDVTIARVRAIVTRHEIGRMFFAD